MKTDEVLFRFNAGRRYHSYLSFARETLISWEETLRYLTNQETLGLPEVMVLIHPIWYTRIGFERDKSFSKFKPAPSEQTCKSWNLYGYECPYRANGIHVDHSFPESLGGIADRENARYLCEIHNTAKSNDIHVLPWEELLHNQKWVERTLKAMISSARLKTGSELPFPKHQLKRF